MSTTSQPPVSAPSGATAADGRDAYHHGDLRAACIEAGLRLVEDGGPEAVTIRGVARHVLALGNPVPVQVEDALALHDQPGQPGFLLRFLQCLFPSL